MSKLERKVDLLKKIQKQVSPACISWEVLARDFNLSEFSSDEHIHFRRAFSRRNPNIVPQGQYGICFLKEKK